MISKNPGHFFMLLVFALGIGGTSYADTSIVELRIRNHLFFPDRLEVPANTKIKLLVINEDPTPEEFESYELNREKVIPGHRKAVIFIGPLPPGEYPFFGEFYPKTAQGKIVAVAQQTAE
ncbi:cupredoxin domain-containing protein [Porticoccus sp.]|uniref:cupredoxin domain-containing protein n=1 Tax=Porticoccus sp. TaxID=2024853 RepID=UPI003F69971C